MPAATPGPAAALLLAASVNPPAPGTARDWEHTVFPSASGSVPSALRPPRLSLFNMARTEQNGMPSFKMALGKEGHLVGSAGSARHRG